MTHTHNTRFLKRRLRSGDRAYRCEWCDREIEPDQVLCESCARAELDRELEEES